MANGSALAPIIRRRRVERAATQVPPHAYFLVSAVFHYLGPSFAVLLFARVQVFGVAWLRIVSAALIFSVWRRPWRTWAGLDRGGRRLLLVWGAVLAMMNACFYLAISRLPLGTVAAIEFLPVIALAALGAGSPRNLLALALAVPGVYLLTDIRLAGALIGFVFAFANAALFSVYIVLADKVAKRPQLSGIDGLAAAMLIAAVAITPVGGWPAAHAFADPTALLAGVGVGVSSSVIPYITDQLAMARLPRATYATMVALLPALATIIGILVLAQIPTWIETTGVALVIAGVALHRPPRSDAPGAPAPAQPPVQSATRVVRWRAMARTALDDAADLTAADVLHKRFSALPADATVAHVRDWFAASSHRKLAFLADNGHYAGSLTRDDLAGDLDPTSSAARLARSGTTIAPDAPAYLGYEQAIATGALRVPVVGRDGTLIGVIGVTDDLAAFCGTH